MRQINFKFEQEDLEAQAKILYGLGAENTSVEIAIGYLSIWGCSYPFVDIFISNNKEAEFTACYRKEEGGSPAYVIGAVFNKQSKKYGFHS